MGKVKKGRRKLHHVAPKGSSKGEIKNEDTEMTLEPEETTPSLPPPDSIAGEDNPFSCIRISKDLMFQKLPDFDARSTITSKSFKGMGLKKKEKQKLRHQMWMEKMNAVEADQKREKERKRKSKTAIVGDLTDLQETLPTLELLLKKTSKESRSSKPAKPKGIQKESQRRKGFLNDIAVFKQVLNHPAYKENPCDTISLHLKNKMQQSEENS